MTVIDPEAISDYPYCKSYFLHLLQYKRFYLNIYSHVLELLLQHTRLPMDELIIVDYGAGNGLLGLFAKHCGFGKVYINDVNEKFVKAAEKTAQLMNIFIDGFITGDMDNVAAAFPSAKPNAVIGTDVIEHIYDLDIFFKQLQRLNPAMTTVFTTAANAANPFKKRRLQQLQWNDENKGGLPGDYALFGEDAIEPFRITRQKILAEYFPALTGAETELLTIHTRGLNKKDIINAGEKYIAEKILPPLLAHPTNTCEPLSGSWTEHLLTIKEYKAIYNEAGFQLTVYNGFYNAFSGDAKSLLMKFANWSILILGKRLAPFVSLIGTAIKE
ncbi:class I SAM-dependent methyltransferase [Ferruginibacter sp. SUN106]|uniref:class I SAM-dependent methyltransferase n=1 Tax=Ferruginibacter sp. SUN106 TaxID=2978348 RepID=UPI003D365464